MIDYDPTPDISQMEVLDEAATPSWVLDRVESVYTFCWIWKGSRSKRHQGSGKDRAVMMRSGKVTTATRHIWTEMRGPLPKTLVVRHMCDQSMCVRPGHLTIGTYQDNTNDAIRRGKLRPGGRSLTQWKRLKELNLSVDLPQTGLSAYSDPHATHAIRLPARPPAMSPNVTG